MMITELIKMELVDEVGDEHFISIVDEMENSFHKACKGYIDSEFFKASNGIWYMLMHWESRADLKQASKAMMNSEKTLSFRECLNPQKIEISIYDQLKSWNLEN